MISVGIDHWYRLKEYEPEESIYAELKLLGRQYRHYMRMRVESVLELTHLLDYTMPGIKTLLKGWNETNGKDKLGDFVEEYWHYDNITKKSEEQFIESYLKWAKEKGYHQSQDKAAKIYMLALMVSPQYPPIPHRPKCWYKRQYGCYEKSITL